MSIPDSGSEYINRHFSGWHQPMLKNAVESLCMGWEKGVLDLRNTLIIVPTRNAGRRLREALAEAAEKRGSAVIPGPVAPPEYLVHAPVQSSSKIASSAETMAAWCQVLISLKAGEFRYLFPEFNHETSLNQQWVPGTAKKLIRLQSDLAENGLSVRAARQLLQDSPLQPEPERWDDLEQLEKKYSDQLACIQRKDPNAAKIENVVHPAVPEGIEKIKLFGVADPLPLTLLALRRLAGRVTIDIYIHAPPEMADYFDQWGRPLTEKWQSRTIAIPDPEQNLILQKNPEKQAEAVASLMPINTSLVDNFAVGVPDEEVIPFLESELQTRGLSGFNPAGRKLERHSLTKLTLFLLRFLLIPDFRNFAALLRHPVMIAYWQRAKPDLQIAGLLDRVDSLQNDRLPVTFDDLGEYLAEKDDTGDDGLFVHQSLAAFLQRIRQGESLPVLLCRMLREFHTPCRLNPHDSADQEFKQAARATVDVLQAFETPTVQGLRLPPRILLALIEEQLRNERIFSERPASAVDLQGWLELAWEDAAHLILTGMNEQRVPATVIGDPFLPDSARTILGLSDNQRRFARDAFLLQAMIESRRGQGSTTLVLGQQSSQGDPLKPSRLLFLCSDRELPERVRRLFAECDESTPSGSRALSWSLRLPAARKPRKLNVTQLNAYLACPFRFYLAHVLKMERKDDRKMEMDALDFGTICHAALQVLGLPELRGITEAQPIEVRLLAELERVLAGRFGQSRPPTLYFQIEAMRQRLRAVARCQARLHQQGWQVVYQESEGEKSIGITINGMDVKGRIDRIDRHADGTLRILDYKTSETAQSPARILWTSPREGQTRDYAVVEVNGRTKAWADLQLPLYLMLAREKFPVETLQAGYFHLPKALDETGVKLWEEATPELLDSARTCTAGIVGDIKEGRFWPPSEKVAYDDFTELFFGPPEECFTVAHHGSSIGWSD